MSLGKCCISGFIHDGTPSGSIQEVGGVRTYVTLPKGDYDKTKALLFLTDIFGVDTMPNGLLLADSFAANGIATYIPDYIHGDAADLQAFVTGNFDLPGWLSNHGKDVTRPTIDKVQNALKAQGVTRFAATGYCFGGRYVTDMVLDDSINVGVVAHPALLQVPDDIEALAKKSTPMLWNNALQDSMFDKKQQATAKEIFQKANSTNHKMLDWEGGHGFAIRGDPTDEAQKASADGAFEASVQFLKEHL